MLIKILSGFCVWLSKESTDLFKFLILGGIVVKEIGVDDLGQPTVNGKPVLKFRIEKHLPDEKKSKKTLKDEKRIKHDKK